MTSTPKGAWEMILEIMRDQNTHRPTDTQTDMRAHREVSLPIIEQPCDRYKSKQSQNKLPMPTILQVWRAINE